MDGPSARRIIELSTLADAKNLKVGVGLMARHNSARQELFQQLREGAAGDIITLRGYRMHPAVQGWDLFPGPPKDMTELQWQVKRFHCFLWASGGIYSDYYIHHIDEACWMKDAWPVKAEANGGRQMRAKIDDQNFDNYSVEYTFADGTKFFYFGRTIPKAESKFGLFGHGSKQAFQISLASSTPLPPPTCSPGRTAGFQSMPVFASRSSTAMCRAIFRVWNTCCGIAPGRGRKSTRLGANGVVELTPFGFLDRLADLVPPPRKHRHRYHGVFAPNHKLRPAVTALAIGNVSKQREATNGGHGNGGRATGGGCDANPNQKPRSPDTSRIAWAKLMARVGEEFPLECPNCGGDIRLIAFITEPGPIRKILTHLGEPLEPPPVSRARGPPTDWGELVQAHDDRALFQASPDELPSIDIHSH